MLCADQVGSAAVAGVTTVDVWTSLGTVTLRTDATGIKGLLVNAGLTTATAAESTTGQIRVSSGDIPGFSTSIYECPPRSGGSPATNNMYENFYPTWIPINIDGAVGGARITLDYASIGLAPTGTITVTAHVVYEVPGGEAMGPAQLSAFFEPYPMCKGGDLEAVTAVTTTNATAITALDIPGSAKAVRYLTCAMLPDAMESVAPIGYIELKSTIPGIEPQKWPLNAANEALGTPVGTGLWMPRTHGMRINIPCTGKNETITPYANVLIAGATASYTITCGVLWE